MRVIYNCPSCQHPNQETVSETTDKLNCSACSWSRSIPAGTEHHTHPATCLACGCGDIWRRKNFPQQLGVAIVVLAAIVSTVFWAKHEPVWAIGTLMAAAAFDMLLFAVMPDVLVCYRCGARYLRFDPAGETPFFNLETAERHRQEQRRKQK